MRYLTLELMILSRDGTDRGIVTHPVGEVHILYPSTHESGPHKRVFLHKSPLFKRAFIFFLFLFCVVVLSQATIHPPQEQTVIEIYYCPVCSVHYLRHIAPYGSCDVWDEDLVLIMRDPDEVSCSHPRDRVISDSAVGAIMAISKGAL